LGGHRAPLRRLTPPAQPARQRDNIEDRHMTQTAALIDDAAALAEQIASINDRFRQGEAAGYIRLTQGVRALGARPLVEIMNAIACATFPDGNDPYGERDFGQIEIEGTSLFFKIEYYSKDASFEFAAEHPEDETRTDRVLTVMLADEY
jgi:hypothetical protein